MNPTDAYNYPKGYGLPTGYGLVLTPSPIPPLPPETTEESEVNEAPSHTRDIFMPHRFQKIVDVLCQIFTEEGFNAIAGTGHSGLLTAGAVGHKLNIPIIAVRKANLDWPKADSRYVNCILEAGQTYKYGFVDDCIASGATLKNAYSKILEICKEKAVMSGVLLYNGYSSQENINLHLSQAGCKHVVPYWGKDFFK